VTPDNAFASRSAYAFPEPGAFSGIVAGRNDIITARAFAATVAKFG